MIRIGIAFLTAAIGAALIALTIRNRLRGAATFDWPQAHAEIVGSLVRVDKDPDGDTFAAQIAYNYQVAGISHHGTRVRYGAYATSNRKQAERTVVSYPVGSRHPVFVNPNDPKDAVLECGTSPTNLLITMLGCVFLVIGVVVYVLS